MNPSPETIRTPTTPEVTDKEKPGLFRRVIGKIGNGMKEFGKGLYSVVKEVVKVPITLVKGVDAGLSHVPLVGDIYKAGKGIVGGVWGASEHLPIVGDIMQGLRNGSRAIAEKIGLTEPEKKDLKKAESDLMKSVQGVRDAVARDMPESELKKDILSVYGEILATGAIQPGKMEAIMKKYPEVGKILQDSIDRDKKIKTGKENMTTEALISEGELLGKKMLELGKQKNGKDSGAIQEIDYARFKEDFPELPELDTMDTNSERYKLLQNIYFNREPKPDTTNETVKEYIKKSLALSLSKPDEKGKIHEEYTTFVLNNSKEIASSFNLNDFEKTHMELSLNRLERQKRVVPGMPHGYSGPDYGMKDLHEKTENMFFKNDGMASDQRKNEDTIIKQYGGLFLDIFPPQVGH